MTTQYKTPQLQDALGRDLRIGDWVYLRAGGGTLRFGKIQKINFKETYNNHHGRGWKLKVSVKTMTSSELSFYARTGKHSCPPTNSTSGVAGWSVPPAGQRQQYHQPPGSHALWTAGWLIVDQEILTHLTKAIV